MNNLTLPPAPTGEHFDALDLDAPVFAQVAAALAGAPDATVTRFRIGSLPVFAVGRELVIKMYPPCFLQEGDHEARWLAQLSGRLPIPTPELLDRDTRDGWGWVCMRRVQGTPANECWTAIPPDERMRLSTALGEALAALHALDVPTTLARFDWDVFVQQQRKNATIRQLEKGLPKQWADQINPFLDELSLPNEPRVPLHTEIMRRHLCVTEDGGRWRLTGLVDFEPSTLGTAMYEFSSVGLFWACGNPALLGATLDGYGHAEGAEVSLRLMGWTLLHRYSNLPWYFRRLPPPDRVTSLRALAEHWFGV